MNDGPPMQGAGRSRFTALLRCSIVFVAALAVRYLFLCELRDHSYLGNIRVSDARTYFEVAQQIGAGTLPFEPYWQAPLYPLLLALFQSAFGSSLHAAQWLHIAIGSLNCVLLFRLSDSLFGPRTAQIAALVAIFYAPFWLFDVQPLPANLTILLELLLVSCFLRYREGGGTGWVAASGLLLGAAIVTHGLAIFSLPVFVYHLARRRAPGSMSGGKAGAQLALFLALAALAPASATIRNSIAAGTPVFVSYNAGINLYIGNHRDLEKTLGRRGGYEWGELFRDPYTSGAKEPAAMNRFFFGRVIEEWLEAPGAMLVSWAQKFLLSVSGSEPKRNFPIYPLRESSRMLRVLLFEVEAFGSVVFAFPAGLVIPLMAVGFVLLRSGRIESRLGRERALLPGWVAIFHLIGMLVFFPTARYRVPALILLLPYAAAAALMACRGVQDWLSQGASLQVRAGAGSAAVALLFALVNPVAANVFRHPLKNRAEHLYFCALWAKERLDLSSSGSLEARMIAQAHEAMRIDPRYPEPVGLLAVYFVYRDIDRSLGLFARLNELVPNDGDVLAQVRAAVAIRDAQREGAGESPQEKPE